MQFLQYTALGMLLVAFFAVECFSAWWTLNAGDPPSPKLPTRLGVILYYNGYFILVSLMGAGALAVFYLVGRIAFGG